MIHSSLRASSGGSRVRASSGSRITASWNSRHQRALWNAAIRGKSHVARVEASDAEGNAVGGPLAAVLHDGPETRRETGTEPLARRSPPSPKLPWCF